MKLVQKFVDLLQQLRKMPLTPQCKFQANLGGATLWLISSQGPVGHEGCCPHTSVRTVPCLPLEVLRMVCRFMNLRKL